MNRLQIKLIIGIMSISLIGIITVQFFWIRQAIDVKETQFDQSVNQALTQIVEQIETYDAARFFTNRIKFSTIDSLSDLVMPHQHDIKIDLQRADLVFTNIFLVEPADLEEIVLDEDFDLDTENIEWNLKAEAIFQPLNTLIRFSGNKADTIHLLSRNLAQIKERKLQLSDFENQLRIKQELKDQQIKAKELGQKAIEDMKKQALIEYRLENLGKTVKKIAYEYAYDEEYFFERLNKIDLEGIIEDELYEKDIPLDFDFAVIDLNIDSIYRLHSAHFDEGILYSKYSANLHPKDIRDKDSFLVLQFPGRQAHIFQSIFLLLGGSILFTVIIIMIFSYTIYIIIKQKKVSEIKSDFINNMTHEFKTPIATISLAVDSINNPSVIGNKKQVNYYSNIIKEENSRMNAQVENVLQMSLIDKKDLELNLAFYDLHHLINKSLKNISLHIEKRTGMINTEFLAENRAFKVDEVHFTNVINNLLDNAIKYSKEAPEITLTTLNTKNGIQIIVEDKGIGMTHETQNKIFDKFYRVPTGNIHNIKGFGLGLSYVKAIIESFGGSVELWSELGAGSKFSIFLPYKQD